MHWYIGKNLEELWSIKDQEEYCIHSNRITVISDRHFFSTAPPSTKHVACFKTSSRTRTFSALPSACFPQSLLLSRCMPQHSVLLAGKTKLNLFCPAVSSPTCERSENTKAQQQNIDSVEKKGTKSYHRDIPSPAH